MWLNSWCSCQMNIAEKEPLLSLLAFSILTWHIIVVEIQYWYLEQSRYTNIDLIFSFGSSLQKHAEHLLKFASGLPSLSHHFPLYLSWKLLNVFYLRVSRYFHYIRWLVHIQLFPDKYILQYMPLQKVQLISVFLLLQKMNLIVLYWPSFRDQLISCTWTAATLDSVIIEVLKPFLALQVFSHPISVASNGNVWNGYSLKFSIW